LWVWWLFGTCLKRLPCLWYPSWEYTEAFFIWSKSQITCSIKAAETQATQLKETSSALVMNVRSNKTNQGHNPEKYGICTCGECNHQAKDCCYKDAMCHKCNKQGYLARMCRSKKSSTTTLLRQHSQHANWVDRQQQWQLHFPST